MQIPAISGLSGSIPSTVDPQQRQALRPNAQADLQALNVTSTAVNASGSAQGQQPLEDAVKKLNDTVKLFSNSSLQFSIDQDTGTPLVKVIDTATKDVIRQIPSEEALAIAKAIDQFKGMLIKEQA
ncbi:flagellar protein FlaG [Andreprevotia lacus DSM 23236]|jgi:flagellar protein FlaG|uniref:Flagellar protein FlaG n=1 Tax=Andreprevotia lacus DSM 23236 TaxID=1121001 RepID=A0A1W1XI50_9NEIS|nr:flagellar protein FlaG [Andreprevotia lacus]SMC23454.1 flagellar protein FlaG [Andreprevotia lacus DSM 23236]